MYPNVMRVKFLIFDGPDISRSNNPWADYTDNLEIYPVQGNIENLFNELSKNRNLPLKIIHIIRYNKRC
jgi:hypothetical protein